MILLEFLCLARIERRVGNNDDICEPGQLVGKARMGVRGAAVTTRPAKEALMNNSIAIVAAAAVVVSLTGAPAGAADFVKKYKDWSAYRHDAAPAKVCFAATQPKDSEPKGLNRGDIFFYVSFYPDDKVSNEISIKLGYPVKADKPVVVSIGSDSFEFFAKGDKAFIEKPDVEKKFVEAMKKGEKMVVKGTSQKGTETTDVFSLFGAGAAVKLAQQSCP